MNSDLRVVNVLSKVNVFQSLEFIGVRLPRGHYTQQIICPFHEDTRPSARVYSDTGRVFCFTCHKLWDSLSLVMQAKRLDLYDAVEILERHFGIDPNNIDLEATVKFNLGKRPLSNISQFQVYVENRLIEGRFRLGLDKYVKTLVALDTYAQYFKEGKISPEQFRDAIHAILRLVQKVEGVEKQSALA